MITVVFAIPLFFVLHVTGIEDKHIAITAILAGAIIGAGCGGFVAWNGGDIAVVPVTAALGLAAGLAFWAVLEDGKRDHPIFSGKRLAVAFASLFVASAVTFLAAGHGPDIWRQKAYEIWQQQNDRISEGAGLP